MRSHPAQIEKSNVLRTHARKSRRCPAQLNLKTKGVGVTLKEPQQEEDSSSPTKLNSHFTFPDPNNKEHGRK